MSCVLSTVILHFALSLLRYSSACCDKHLQIALGFLSQQSFIMLRYFSVSFSCLSDLNQEESGYVVIY